MKYFLMCSLTLYWCTTSCRPARKWRRPESSSHLVAIIVSLVLDDLIFASPGAMTPTRIGNLRPGYQVLQMSKGTECGVALLFPTPPTALSSPCLKGIVVASQRAVCECWEGQKIILTFTIFTCCCFHIPPFHVFRLSLIHI